MLLYFVLVGCNVADTTTSSGGSTNTNSDNSQEQSNIYSPSTTVPSGSVVGYQFTNFSHIQTFDNISAATSYSVSNLPSWASFNTSTGEISGDTQQGLFSNVQVTKFYSGGSETKTFNIFIHGDPLFVYSWHLKNTGQSAFSASGGSSGEDINLMQTISDGIFGDGVKILISDTGVDESHEDLDANLVLSTSKNYNDSNSAPSDSNGHGTAVAGIIGAEALNNVGGRGIAPSADISVKNFLVAAQTTANLIDQASGNFDIYNFSYGDLVYHDQQTNSDYIDQLAYGVTSQRSGKGSIYVKSAGNEFYITTKNYNGISNPVFSHNANLPLDNEQPYLVVVGALNAKGKKAKYSNAGSNIWVSAPGGEDDYGQNNPAIITTDISGCSKGYSKQSSNPVNSFEYNHSLNTVCNYTSTMNGTSSAAPIVAAASALILEANPNLSWRDVKHIIASTARQVDSSIGDTEHPSKMYKSITNFDLSNHVYEQGWITNGAGFKFHNWYGFGAIDIDAAVAMAKTYSVNLGTFTNQSYVSAPDIAIPDNSSTGASDTINVTGNLVVESIQLTVDVTHLSSGDLGVELTSPDGTKSILLNINNSLLLGSDANLTDVVLLSNAFYGESSTGNWTIKVIDGRNGATGRLKDWKITVFGHAP
jgi:subtilisin-like proprotein convertase family protein